MNYKTLGVAAVAAAVLAAAGGWWWWSQQGSQAPEFRTAAIERGRIVASVSASGTVNPVTQVSVGTQVSGQLRSVLVDFNAEVKAGQLIAEIDPETFEYRVRSAQADLDVARAAVLTAQANAAASRAGVARAQSDLAEAQRTHERNLSLVAQAFIAQSEADRTRAALNSATEQLRSAQAQTGVSEAQIRSAQAGVAQREASLAQARIDLARTRITSPVNGIVIKRAVEKGQTVAASLQSPELFVIAQNLRDMQVEASIDESDVGRIRSGQKASFTVDAFPGRTFEGVVAQVRKAAQNVANVVTYVAVITFANADNLLLPGMTANVRVIIEQRDGVLKVPNAALRVRLPAAAGSALAPASGPAAQMPQRPPQDAAARRSAPSGPSGAGRSRANVYVLQADGLPRAVSVRLGITDGSFTELLTRAPAGAPAAAGTSAEPQQPAPGAAQQASAGTTGPASEPAALAEGDLVIIGVQTGPAPGARPPGGPRMSF